MTAKKKKENASSRPPKYCPVFFFFFFDFIKRRFYPKSKIERVPRGPTRQHVFAVSPVGRTETANVYIVYTPITDFY